MRPRSRSITRGAAMPWLEQEPFKVEHSWFEQQYISHQGIWYQFTKRTFSNCRFDWMADRRWKAAKVLWTLFRNFNWDSNEIGAAAGQHIGKENQQDSLLSSGTNPAVMWPCIVVYMCQDLVNNSEGSQLQNYVCRDFPEAIKPPPPPYPSPQNVCLFEVDILFWFSHKIVDWTPCTFQFCLRNKW